MKHLLLTTIAAVMLVGCGPSASDISIHDAAAGGHIKAIKQHLTAGTDVNARDVFGGIPLHQAAGYGRKVIAELLIAKGADVNAKDDNPGGTPLHSAANGGQKEIAELLIAKGADVNADEGTGLTPLHQAAKSGDNVDKEIAELLIAAGADVNAQEISYNRETPLVYAKGEKEIADLLRKHGGKTGEELKAEAK